MALIVWNEDLSVGIQSIDQQHKKMVAIINRLDDAMKKGQGAEIQGYILADLVDYTIVHFRTEEDYFDKFGYTETISHKLEHQMFIDKVSGFYESFHEGNSFLSIEIMDFLSSWLQSHIKVKDKGYIGYFKEYGLK